ncbi:MAG: lipopolysaccharide biosynthesis protein [Epsilonproteobacteria bacterium]|nr:lipopolysaccharide biosynthesis protein [Campylobacterota bacterium]
MEDSLKKRYSIKLFANIISALINAILIAIVPKELGPLAYGRFTYLQSFFMKIIGFLDMGSSIAFFTKLSAKNTRKELISFYFIYSLSILFLVFFFLYLIDILDYIKIILPDIPSRYVYFGLLFGFFTWLTQVFIKISDAYALTVSVELIKVGHKAISVLLLLYFVYFTSFDLKSYFYFNYIALSSFLLILSWLFIKKSIFDINLFDLSFGFKKISKEFISYCSPLVVYSIIGLVVGFFDIWLLQKFSGSIETGYYGLAYSFAAMCFLFTSAMTPIITREFARSYEQKDMAQMRSLFFRYIPMLYALAAYFGIFISMQSENVLIIFTDEKFQNAYLVLVIMAFYPLHQTYGQLSGSIFYATGQTKLMKNIGLISMGVGLVLSFTLIYILNLGAVGLAWKMIIGQFIGVNIQLYYNAKFLDFKIKSFVWHQIYTVVFFVILAYISSNIIIFNSPLVDFLLSGFIYTILVTIFTYIFPQIFATTRDEIKYNLLRLKNVIKK